MKPLSECKTKHEKIEFLCNRWLELATDEYMAEGSRDNCHGMWCALMVYDADQETRDMVLRYEQQIRDKRDSFKTGGE